VVCSFALALSAPIVAAAAPAPTAPSVSTGAATSITQTSATLNGTVNPKKSATTFYFQYGKTASYGLRTATQGPTSASKNDISVHAGISKLTPGTIYHYRLVAQNAVGTTMGGDRSFATANALSLGARPNPVTYGSSTVLSGLLQAPNHTNVLVTLRQNPYPYSGYVSVATTRTDPTGHYAFARRFPKRNTRYVAVAQTSPGGSTSSPVRFVGVAIRVTLYLSTNTPTKGQRVFFSGSATPAHDGRTVYIQRRNSNGTWTTLVTTTLHHVDGKRSSYHGSIHIYTSATYRARVLGDADHATGARRRDVRVL